MFNSQAHVYCPHCEEFLLSKDVKSKNIHEDEQGRDVITFVCKHCKNTVESVVRVF